MGLDDKEKLLLSDEVLEKSVEVDVSDLDSVEEVGLELRVGVETVDLVNLAQTRFQELLAVLDFDDLTYEGEIIEVDISEYERRLNLVKEQIELAMIDEVVGVEGRLNLMKATFNAVDRAAQNLREFYLWGQKVGGGEMHKGCVAREVEMMLKDLLFFITDLAEEWNGGILWQEVRTPGVQRVVESLDGVFESEGLEEFVGSFCSRIENWEAYVQAYALWEDVTMALQPEVAKWGIEYGTRTVVDAKNVYYEAKFLMKNTKWGSWSILKSALLKNEVYAEQQVDAMEKSWLDGALRGLMYFVKADNVIGSDAEDIAIFERLFDFQRLDFFVELVFVALLIKDSGQRDVRIDLQLRAQKLLQDAEMLAEFESRFGGEIDFSRFCELIAKYPTFKSEEAEVNDEVRQELDQLHQILFQVLSALMAKEDEAFQEFLYLAILDIDHRYVSEGFGLFIKNCPDNQFIQSSIKDKVMDGIFSDGDLELAKAVGEWQKEGIVDGVFDQFEERLAPYLKLAEIPGMSSFVQALRDNGNFKLSERNVDLMPDIFRNRGSILSEVTELAGYISRYQYDPYADKAYTADGGEIRMLHEWPKDLVLKLISARFQNMSRYLGTYLLGLLSEEAKDFEDWFLEILFVQALHAQGVREEKFEGGGFRRERLKAFNQVFRRFWRKLNEIDGEKIIGGKRTWDLLEMVELMAKRPEKFDRLMDLVDQAPNLFGWSMRDGGMFCEGRKYMLTSFIREENMEERILSLEQILTEAGDVREQIFAVIEAAMPEAFVDKESKSMVEINGARLPFEELNREDKLRVLKDIHREVVDQSLVARTEGEGEKAKEVPKTINFHQGMRCHLTSVDALAQILTAGNFPGEFTMEGRSDAYPFHTDLLVLPEDVNNFGAVLDLPMPHLPNNHQPTEVMSPKYYGSSGRFGVAGRIGLIYPPMLTERSSFPLHEGEELKHHELVLGGLPVGDIQAIVVFDRRAAEQALLAMVHVGYYLPVYSLEGDLLVQYDDYLQKKEDLGAVAAIENWEGAWPAGQDEVGSGGMDGGIYYQPTVEGMEKHYVKFGNVHDFGQVAREIIADRMYQRAGVKVVKSEMVKVNGKIGRRTKWVDALSKQGVDVWSHEDWKAGAVMDWWLANWDVANERNVLMVEGDNGTEVVRLDNGGALDKRASGERKERFGGVVLEAFTNFDSQRPFSEGMRQLYRGLTIEEIRSQVKKLKENFTDQVILEIVESVPGIPLVDIWVLVEVLKGRRDWLYQAVVELGMDLGEEDRLYWLQAAEMAGWG